MSLTITETEQVAGHLGASFESIYRVIGSLAPTVSADAACVALFEIAREAGGVADRFATLLAARADVDPRESWHTTPVIDEVLRAAVERDASGQLALYAIASVVGPRLLVSLRDAASLTDLAAGGPLRSACEAAATWLVATMRRIGEVAARLGAPDEVTWREHARTLEDPFVAAGLAESLGTGLSG